MNAQNDLDLNNIARIVAANRNAEYTFVPAGYSVRNIKTDGGNTYVGYSAPSTLESDKAWVIKRVSESGSDITNRWAVDVKWSDVLTESYNL